MHNEKGMHMGMTPLEIGKELTAYQKPKVPMQYAAALLTEICERIDNGEPLDEAVVACFNFTKLDLAEAVDRRIAFDTWIKGAMAAASNAAREWKLQAERLEMVHERFKEKTKAIVEENPGLPYQGKLGKIVVKNNPPAVELAFSDKNLTHDMVGAIDGLINYIKIKTTISVDKAKLSAELKSGVELPWATLTQGKRVEFGK